MFSEKRNFNGRVGHWDTSNVTNMISMFSGASTFNQPIGGWNTSKVTDMSYMFSGASDFNQPIGGWNTSKVTDMCTMFYRADAFNQPIGGWNTSKVTNMGSMFYLARAFNQPIGDWNTRSVTTMRRMFGGARAFNQPIGGWDTSKVSKVSMYDMFGGASAFNQDLSPWIRGRSIDFTREFVLDTVKWNITRTVEHLRLPVIFDGIIQQSFDVRSVTMLRIIRGSYPQYRVDNRHYNRLIRLFYGTGGFYGTDVSPEEKRRVIRLLDFIRREDMRNPPNKRYRLNQTTKNNIKTLDQETMNQKTRVAALRGLDRLPRELRHKIMYDAGLVRFPETWLNGRVHGNGLR